MYTYPEKKIVPIVFHNFSRSPRVPQKSYNSIRVQIYLMAKPSDQ